MYPLFTPNISHVYTNLSWFIQIYLLDMFTTHYTSPIDRYWYKSLRFSHRLDRYGYISRYGNIYRSRNMSIIHVFIKVIIGLNIYPQIYLLPKGWASAAIPPKSNSLKNVTRWRRGHVTFSTRLENWMKIWLNIYMGNVPGMNVYNIIT